MKNYEKVTYGDHIYAADSQWEMVLEEREQHSIGYYPYSIESDLERSWSHLKSCTDPSYNNASKLRDERLGERPFDDFMFYLSIGLYPPPELLTYIRAAWAVHVSSEGQVSFEKLLLGKSIKKSGNAGKRISQIGLTNKIIAMISIERLETDCTKEAAAETVAHELGYDQNPEFDLQNFIRQLRHNPRWKDA